MASLNLVRAEIAVVGGALAGAAVARALEGAPVALISRERRIPAGIGASFDSRIYAISPAMPRFSARSAHGNASRRRD